MEREGQEENEGAERGVSLEVDVDVVAAALQVDSYVVAVPVSVLVPAVCDQRRPLLRSPVPLFAGQNDLLQNEDEEEADSHDERRNGKIALLEKQKTNQSEGSD